MGGVGKTMLTAAVVRDERVRRGFECIACELFNTVSVVHFSQISSSFTVRVELIPSTRSTSAAKAVVPAAAR